VVQTRGPDGDIEMGADTDPAVQYDGPLVVLTSRFSASASEILAGAMQDYGRALLVGDSSTFGKGTVQNVVPLARMMDRNGLAYSYDPGALKVTIRKFYRPGGASTQLRGVASDIVLPSPSDFSDVNEASLTDPLPWDSVRAAQFQAVNRVQPHVAGLRERSSKRVAAGKDFAFLREEIALLKKSLDSKSITLNEAERRKELARSKARKEQREQFGKALRASRPTTYEITLKNSATPGLPAPVAPSPSAQATPKGKGGDDGDLTNRRDAQSPLDEILLNESLHILTDYAGVLGGKPAGKTATPAHEARPPAKPVPGTSGVSQ